MTLMLNAKVYVQDYVDLVAYNCDEAFFMGQTCHLPVTKRIFSLESRPTKF